MPFIAFGVLGASGFVLLGLVVLLVSLRQAQAENQRASSWQRIPGVMVGEAMFLLAGFIVLFVLSVVSSNGVVKIITILMGILLCGFPALCMAILGLKRFLQARNRLRP